MNLPLEAGWNRFVVLLTSAFFFLCLPTGTKAQGEPLGGQPERGAKQSVKDLGEQVAYQRAFEAVLWAMPASAIYRFRVGLLEVPGMADNVIIANSGPLKTIQEVITGNQVTPYLAAATDLRNGPVVLEVPAATEKAVLYGQVVDAWQSTIAGVGPVGEDKGAGASIYFYRLAIRIRFLLATFRSNRALTVFFWHSARFSWEERRKPTPTLIAKR